MLSELVEEIVLGLTEALTRFKKVQKELGVMNKDKIELY